MVNEEWDKLIGNDDFTRYYFQKRTESKTGALNTFGKFTPTQLRKYEDLLGKFIEQHKNDGEKEDKSNKSKKNNKEKKVTTKAIGNTLEDLISFIFNSLPMFKVAGKVRTNSNEIDHVIMLSDKGRSIKSDGLIDFSQNHFLSEAKNYGVTIQVTWVNKLYSLLSSTGTRIGIVFSYHGLTGKTQCGGWQEAKGFTKKVLLASLGLNPTEEDMKNAIYIIDFNIDHFLMLKENKSIVEIIENEMLTMKLDAKAEIDATEKHENEVAIIKIMKEMNKMQEDEE